MAVLRQEDCHQTGEIYMGKILDCIVGLFWTSPEAATEKQTHEQPNMTDYGNIPSDPESSSAYSSSLDSAGGQYSFSPIPEPVSPFEQPSGRIPKLSELPPQPEISSFPEMKIKLPEFSCPTPQQKRITSVPKIESESSDFKDVLPNTDLNIHFPPSAVPVPAPAQPASKSPDNSSGALPNIFAAAPAPAQPASKSPDNSSGALPDIFAAAPAPAQPALNVPSSGGSALPDIFSIEPNAYEASARPASGRLPDVFNIQPSANSESDNSSSASLSRKEPASASLPFVFPVSSESEDKRTYDACVSEQGIAMLSVSSAELKGHDPESTVPETVLPDLGTPFADDNNKTVNPGGMLTAQTSHEASVISSSEESSCIEATVELVTSQDIEDDPAIQFLADKTSEMDDNIRAIDKAEAVTVQDAKTYESLHQHEKAKVSAENGFAFVAASGMDDMSDSLFGSYDDESPRMSFDSSDDILGAQASSVSETACEPVKPDALEPEPLEEKDDCSSSTVNDSSKLSDSSLIGGYTIKRASVAPLPEIKLYEESAPSTECEDSCECADDSPKTDSRNVSVKLPDGIDVERLIEMRLKMNFDFDKTVLPGEEWMSFQDLFKKAGVPRLKSGMSLDDIIRFISMEEYGSYSFEEKQNVILEHLQAKGVSIRALLEDAVRKDKVIDTYEEFLNDRIERRRMKYNTEIEILERKIEARRKAIAEDQANIKRWNKSKLDLEVKMRDACAYLGHADKMTVGLVTEGAVGRVQDI